MFKLIMSNILQMRFRKCCYNFGQTIAMSWKKFHKDKDSLEASMNKQQLEQLVFEELFRLAILTPKKHSKKFLAVCSLSFCLKRIFLTFRLFKVYSIVKLQPSMKCYPLLQITSYGQAWAYVYLYISYSYTYFIGSQSTLSFQCCYGISQALSYG